jgi:hypothetical protein
MRPDEIREYHRGECGYELEFGEDQGDLPPETDPGGREMQM